ncbi:tudor domain-containing protein 5 [Plakobranchus ocellatus]|uniref:Tudor domain-containing protein 5 n=1 Tax=Plakobranchus ocellatus TaxID=259542 RepID=A0AAV4B744_9GAST|nr:tudor domain-containing protein 5 [Plakobranchus ocellatus]
MGIPWAVDAKEAYEIDSDVDKGHVTLEKSGSEIKVFGVGDPNSYLPVGARKAQGRLPKNYHKNLQAAKENDSGASLESDSMDSLEPDQAGWYSLCCPIEKVPSFDTMELENLFIQAGSPVKIHMTDRWLFVRYKERETVEKALEIFGNDFSLRPASKKSNKSTDLSGEDKKKGQKVEKKSSGPASKKYQKDVCKSASSRAVDENSKSQINGEKVNGYESNGVIQENGIGKHQKVKDLSKSLFVNGICDKALFLKLIEPYKPLHTKFVAVSKDRSRFGLWYGFVEMQTVEEAKKVITDLNRKQLGDKYIIVDYDTPKESKPDKSKKDSKGSVNEKTENQAKQNKANEKSSQKALPNPEFLDMPPLVHESAYVQNPDYYKDCTVFIGNFPANTTLFALQDAFSKYHIKDIIIAVNNFSEGCTKAFLYLSSIMDVIHCVEEMNGFTLQGYHLKVDVPYKNEKMRHVLKKRLQLKTQEESASLNKPKPPYSAGFKGTHL